MCVATKAIAENEKRLAEPKPSRLGAKEARLRPLKKYS